MNKNGWWDTEDDLKGREITKEEIAQEICDELSMNRKVVLVEVMDEPLAVKVKFDTAYTIMYGKFASDI